MYMHIPFCARKCAYCDFASVGICDLTDADTVISELIDALILEIDMRIDDIDDIGTIFIGGGTPSIVPVDTMERLLHKIKNIIDDKSTRFSEWTIECNPGTVDEDKLRLYKQYGINRISFGLQSASDKELRELGRIHSYSDFISSYELARKVGFDNINIDLMSAIPSQTYESYKNTLESVIGLRPEHISTYSLIIEEGTYFYEKYKDSPPTDEDTDLDMFKLAHDMLEDAGYTHYEISNYAFGSDHVCRHNINYWKRGEYIGIGPSASSHIDSSRTTNIKNIKKYTKAVLSGKLPIAEEEKLSDEQKLIEDIYLGLRMSEGIDIKNLSDRYDMDYKKLWDTKLSEFTRQGLICYNQDTISLTPEGMWVSDYLVNSLLNIS